MSSNNKGWKDILDAHFDKRARDFIHTSFPATVIRVVNAGVVDVQPVVSTKRPDGTVIPYGELFDVRIHSYGVSSDVGIKLPIKVGMKVWVFVSERDTVDYMQSEQIVSSTTATHDLSDCFCIPQFFTDQDIPELNTEDIIIQNKSSTISIKPSSVVIEASSIEAVGEVWVEGNVNVQGYLEALELIVDGNAGIDAEIVVSGQKYTFKKGLLIKQEPT